jgi:hypothetical protein
MQFWVLKQEMMTGPLAFADVVEAQYGEICLGLAQRRQHAFGPPWSSHGLRVPYWS